MSIPSGSFADKQRKLLKGIIISFVVCLLLECFLFNFRFWQTLSYDSITPSGIEYNAEERTVTLTGFDCHLNNLYLDLFDENSLGEIRFEILANDATNSDGFLLPSTNVVAGIKESQYIPLELVGNTNKVVIRFENDINIDSAKFTFNVTRPFHFVLSRFLLILSIGLVIAVLKSRVLDLAVDLSNRSQLIAVGLVSLIFAALWFKIASDSYFPEYVFQYYARANYKEHIYNYLSQALLDGHFDLNIDPPEYLSRMANPYLDNERYQMATMYGQEHYVDFCYFNGRFYCYYGIVPALIFYLPYIALTGNLVHSCYVIALCGLIFIPASFALIYRLVKRFRGDVPFDAYILLSLLFINCSGFLTLVKLPYILSVPMAVSYVLVVLGLLFWFRSIRDDKISVRYLILGSIAIALTLGTRPEYFIALFLAFPIFRDRIVKGEFFRAKKESVRNTLAVMVPFAIIDTLVLLYNFARFGNLFDFGASYNLSRDLFDDRFILARLPYGLFTYFFQPLNVDASFPYVHSVNTGTVLPSDYQGYIYIENYVGGVFAVIPFCLVLFAIPFIIRRMRENRSRFIVFTLIIMVIIVAFVDLEFGGISNRYVVDFSIFLVLAAVITVLTIRTSDPARWRAAVIVVAVLSILLSYFLLLADGRNYNMRDYMPYEFGYFKYLFFNLR